MTIVQLVSYISFAVAVLAMIAKALRYIRAPEHFRWELYPVPHEKGRAGYGGSYLEELDWWSKPRENDMFREIKEMMQEIVLLKGVFHHNKKVWRSSFPFHFGLYLSIGWLLLLLLGSILNSVGIPVGPETAIFGRIVHYVTIPIGYAGLVLTGLGAFGLFIWRVSDKNQRPYNAPAEYFNLVFFDIVVVVALIAQLVSDPGFIIVRQYIGSLATFSVSPALNGWLVAEIILVSLIIMYVPLTRMSHFVAKYFLYHSVRWNDEANMRGSKIEKRIMELMNSRVGWSAPHIQTGEPWTRVVREMNKNE